MNEIVTVVATVIGVDTVMPSVEFMAAEMALIKLAVRAVAFAPVLASSPVGVKVMTKAKVASSESPRPAGASSSTAQPDRLLEAQNAACTDDESAHGLIRLKHCQINADSRPLLDVDDCCAR